MADITGILAEIDAGNASAVEELLPLVYEELRKLAAANLARESSDHTLQPTALVHEAYLRLVDTEKAERWNSRGHFFGAAASAMRRILVDKARTNRSQRRGGNWKRYPLSEEDFSRQPRVEDVVELDETLSRLAETDARAARLVELRVFAGMTIDEVAALLEISPRSAKRSWAYARAWLRREMEKDG